MGCLKRHQIRGALIAAGIEAVDVVQAFDEMDRNRDNLITYEEFRYYVGIVMGDTTKLTVNNLSQYQGNDDGKLNVWRKQWNKAAINGQDKISKDEAIDSMRDAATQPMSPGLVRSLHT